MKYRIYIDEVGNPDLGSSDNLNHRFLSLTGVVVELEYVRTTLYPQIEELKKTFFQAHPDEPLILHRKEILKAKPPFEALSNPETRRRFDEQMLQLLSTWQYTVISVCLDKKRHKDTYATWRYDPYHYCLAVLLERYVLFLKHRGCKGDVFAESRGGKEDMRLKKSFKRLWEEGSQYIEPTSFQEVLTSRQLKVKLKKNNVAGLQLADILAHPSRNEILEEQGLLGRQIGPFARKVIKILQDKYDQHSGRISGAGKKFI